MPIEVIYPRKMNESAKDYSFNNLLFNITTNILPPGVAIEESYIANKLDVSRTPVREAILRLSREHFIDILPQKVLRSLELTLILLNKAYSLFKQLRER